MLTSSLSAVLLVLLTCLYDTTALGNAPGNCLLSGQPADEDKFPNDSPYPSYCSSGYGRPKGVCNCIAGLNSCAQLLAGCGQNSIAMERLVWEPAFPSVLYVGKPVDITINISYAGPQDLCWLRPLPAGLTFAAFTGDSQVRYRLSGAPTESMPMADYGIATARGTAIGPASVFWSFEVQSCSEEDAQYPGTPTTPPVAPVPVPVTPPTPQPPAPCGAHQCPGPVTPPVAAPTTVPIAPEACPTAGHQRCTANVGKYQTCDHGSWQAEQSCQSGLQCTQSGNFVYCSA